MRLLVIAGATIAASLDPSQLTYALGNPAWQSLALAYYAGDAYAGDPSPNGDDLEFVDRANPGSPVGEEGLAEYAVSESLRMDGAGTTWGGFPVATDDRSKTLINGELAAITLGVRQDGEYFGFTDQPRPLTNEEFKELAIAVRSHVTTVIGARFQALGGIASGAVTTRAQVDAILAGG